MANETEFSNYITIGNAVSALIGPYFKDATIAANLVSAENFPANTNAIKFRKNGVLVAETLAEVTAYTPSASSEFTETSVTVTAEKKAVSSEISAEAQRFAGADTSRIAAEQGAAFAALFDAEFKALFAGFSVSDATRTATTLDVDALLGAQYAVLSSKVPAGGNLVAVLSYKQVKEVKGDIINSAASAWGSDIMLDLLGGAPKANNFVGSLAGMDIYQTGGLPVASATDDIGLVFHPRLAFCAGLGGEFSTLVVPKGTEGFYTEVSSHAFWKIAEYYDLAGCRVLSAKTA